MKEKSPMKEQKETEIMAVDCVILPPPEISQFAIYLSEQLREKSPIVLNSRDYLPHISLAMGYIDDLIAAKRLMEQTVSGFGQLSVTVQTISRSAKPFEGHYFYGLAIKKDKSIQQLHESLVSNLPLIKVKKPGSQFFLPEDDGKIVRAVYDYVGSFRTHHSQDNFHPHITLGAGPADRLETDKLPFQFTVNKIYLCQLGNFCTCRKVLAEFPLQKV